MNPLLLLLLLITTVIVVRWLRDWASRHAGSASRSILTWLGLGVLLFLAVTGKLGVIVPLVVAMIVAVLRLVPVIIPFAPLLHRIWRERQARQTRNSGANDRSSVQAKYVAMNLNHATGEIQGSVLYGRFAGRDLHAMSLKDLVALYEECLSDDRDSAALLEAYLDRVHGQRWRNVAGSQDDRRGTRTVLTREEAYQVLGLRPGASREAIIQAHRRLMQKLHPDRGGSDYLAAEINRAKEILLGNS